MKNKLILTILVMLTSFYGATIVQAQENPPYIPTDNEVNEVAKKLYCPVCPNTPLDVCETQACQDWRQQIRDQLAAGWSEEQIMDYFVDQYGERVLAEPQRRGFTSLVWVLPILATLLGLLVIWQIMNTWKSNSFNNDPIPIKESGIPPEILSKIEQEIKELD